MVLQQPQVLLLQQQCVLVSAEEFGEEARRERVATCFFSFANPGEEKKRWAVFVFRTLKMFVFCFGSLEMLLVP